MNKALTDITHEMLTPLTILSASIEQLRANQPEGREEYDLMDLNIQRTVRLLQQILDTSQTQGGRPKLLVSHGDVMKYITETARSTEPLMNIKELEFSIHCQPESMMGWIDTEKLDKIIFNLVSNLANLTPEKGKIAIDVSTNKHYDHVLIRISNTGTGIPMLVLTRELIALHKGTIQSKVIEGQGITILLDLPINKESYSPEQIDENQKIDFNNVSNQVLELSREAVKRISTMSSLTVAAEDAPTLLLVEGNDELRMLMLQLLHSKYHIMTASQGQEVLDTIQKQEPDLIISEVSLPDMDGYDLVTQLKQDPDYNHLPIILLTSGTQEDKERALAIGADSYMSKPFRLGDLQLRIDNIIANRQRVRKKVLPGENEYVQPTDTPRRKTPEEEFMERATRCIMDHIDDSEYDRDAFAADMGASASTLYNKLRTATGMNVVAFIRSVRIRTACQLAKDEPDLRVSDIAYRVGFKDPKYFATSFKKEMGVQPKEYFDNLRGVQAS